MIKPVTNLNSVVNYLKFYSLQKDSRRVIYLIGSEQDRIYAWAPQANLRARDGEGELSCPTGE